MFPNEVRTLKTETLAKTAAGLSGADWIGATPQEGLALSNGQPAGTVMQQLIALHNKPAPEPTIPTASETQAGIVEHATALEVQNGTAGNLVATVARLKAELDRRDTLPAVIAPTLTSGWTPLGGVALAPGYYKDAAGHVHLQGSVAGGTLGTTETIFTLPLGYRPPAELYFATDGGGPGHAKVFIRADGRVVPVSNDDNSRISLDGIIFRGGGA